MWRNSTEWWNILRNSTKWWNILSNSTMWWDMGHNSTGWWNMWRNYTGWWNMWRNSTGWWNILRNSIGWWNILRDSTGWWNNAIPLGGGIYYAIPPNVIRCKIFNSQREAVETPLYNVTSEVKLFTGLMENSWEVTSRVFQIHAKHK